MASKLEKVPFSQAEQAVALAPEKVPAVHNTHTLQLALEYVPATQALQVLARAEPHLHGLPDQAPAGQPGERALLALLDLWLDR